MNYNDLKSFKEIVSRFLGYKSITSDDECNQFSLHLNISKLEDLNNLIGNYIPSKDDLGDINQYFTNDLQGIIINAILGEKDNLKTIFGEADKFNCNRFCDIECVNYSFTTRITVTFYTEPYDIKTGTEIVYKNGFNPTFPADSDINAGELIEAFLTKLVYELKKHFNFEKQLWENENIDNADYCVFYTLQADNVNGFVIQSTDL